MHRYFLVFISLLVFFFTASSATYAQNISPAGTLSPILGCGDATSTTNNKCCYISYADTRISDGADSIKKNIPAIGDKIADLMNFMDSINDRLPFFWLPSEFNPVSLGGLRSALKSVPSCFSGTASEDPKSPSCKCFEDKSNASLLSAQRLCSNIASSSEKKDCEECLSGFAGVGQGSDPGVWTGLGCVKANVQSFISDFVLRIGVGIAGISAFLCIIYGAFMYQTSQGKPETLKKAQELLTSCVMGLLLIIFSIFILRLIGVNILNIPGFS